MKALKGKIFFILLLSAICIGGIGAYSIKNLFELTDRIAQLSNPNKKWELFREITADLHRLNDIFYSQSLNPAKDFDSQHVLLIDSIGESIESLQSLYSKELDSADIKDLNSIPKVLEQIKDDFRVLKTLRKEKQMEVLTDLENDLLSKLDTFSSSDSLNIVDRISLEIRSRNIPDSMFFRQSESNGDSKRRSFLQRLFTRAKPEKKKPRVLQQTYKTVSDTVVHTVSDTVVVERIDPKKSEDHLTGVIKEAFSNYYTNELELMELINQNEIKLYQKSARITMDLEQILNDLRFQENNQMMTQAQRTAEFSKNFQHTIIVVIVSFAVLSLVLVFFVGRDINKNNEYQQQILKNEEKAKREVIAKQQFLTTMSHELRTPLTSIIGYAELLDASDTKARSIKSSSMHLLNVANEILDSAKIESGIIETTDNVFNVTELLHQIRDNTTNMIADAKLEPQYDLPEEAYFVSSDAYRIQQIIYNLIHNAIKFSYKGFVKLSAKVVESNGIYEVNIDVADSGIGIQQSNIDKIFEEYQQIGTYKNKTQGIGLGLGLVKKVVLQLEGTISVTSVLGEGSTFHLFLPLKKSEEPVPTAEISDLSKELLNGKEIYCVDDDPLITKLYDMVLCEYGAHITTVNNPLDALDHLTEMHNKYDLVITDVKMPEMTGHELLAELVNRGARPKNVIASTANVLLNDEEKKELEAYDAYISKPILKIKLLKSVTEVLGVEWDTSGNEEDSGAKSDVSQPVFQIDDLEAFTMGDDDMLKEVLVELQSGNQDMLKQGLQYLRERELVPLGELIHKLSSRFAQIKVKEILPVKPLEKALLNQEDQLKEAEELLTYWSEINHQLKNTIDERFV
ncbi:hybrid sensor histidine kinase/response regulator [Sphingobacterium corticis]|uniref:histidine kinase n=1 Tax=Sphingobacterium corticis TaxID=1812823 RepID=A0ABW5NGR6_9SPHI